MTLRKIAGLLAAFGLTVGLIGGGVGAVFQDQVTATENISVGKVACEITSASPAGPYMVIAPDRKSLTYTPPTITSSAPNPTGLKFDFTVKNTGTLLAVFTVDSPGTGGSPFATYAPAPAGPSLVAPDASISYTGAGVTWGDLSAYAGTGPYSFTWKVNCGEVPPNDPMASTNDANIGKGWANFTAVPGEGTVELTFHQSRSFASCFEYRTDGDVSQKIGDANYNAGIHDGLYPFKCLTAPGTQVVTLGPTIGYVEVRMVFGAEADERFDWTRVDALP